MKIDSLKANLLEKDIEDWLHVNPQVLHWYHMDNPIVKWIGRQYTLPSGIADLIGVRENGLLVVIEVKNVPINKAAVLQVCRYAMDLKHVVNDRMNYTHLHEGGEPFIEKILVGPSIDGQTFTEAMAVGVRVFQFAVELSLEVGSMDWSHEHHSRVVDQRSEVALRPEWNMFGPTSKEYYEEQYRTQAANPDDLIEQIEKHAREYADNQIAISQSDDEEELF